MTAAEVLNGNTISVLFSAVICRFAFRLFGSLSHSYRLTHPPCLYSICYLRTNNTQSTLDVDM